MNFRFLLFFLLFFTSQINAQEILTDTSYIKFNSDSIIPFNINIEKVSDKRNTSPGLVAYSTSKKFLLIPVDKEICTNNPLSEEIKESLKPTNKISNNFDLSINHFKIKKERRRFSSFYVLETDILVVKDSIESGYLSYNFRFNPVSRKASMEDVSEEIIRQWHPQFKVDLLTTDTYLRNPQSPPPESYLPYKYNRSSNFSITLTSYTGLDFWQMDGEIYFSRPETEKNNVMQGGIIRYQNARDYEMIGFGKRSEHFHQRIAPSWLIDINTNLLIGINKWKDTEGIKLQQVFQFSLSSSQTINFNKKNKSGIILKAGLYENLYYILEKVPKLQLGISLGVGYKL